MRNGLLYLLLSCFVVLCLPKEVYHHHEHEVEATGGCHADEDCFTCDVDLGFMGAPLMVCGTIDWLSFPSLNAPLTLNWEKGQSTHISLRGPPALS